MAESLPPGSAPSRSASRPSTRRRGSTRAESAPDAAKAERRTLKEAQRRRQRRIDMALLAVGVLALLALAVGIQGQQRKLDRATQEIAELRQQLGLPAGQSASAGPASPAAARLQMAHTADAAPALADAAYHLAGIEKAASQALDCPKAADAQLAWRRQFLAPIDYWGRTRLADLPARRVTYLFAGPDIATAAALFGRTDHLVLVADQWVETWDMQAPRAEQRQAECDTASYFARYGYFRTRHLEGLEGAKVRPRFLQLLLHNLHLADLQLEAAHYLVIGTDGEARAAAPAAGERQAGIRFHVRRLDGSRARIDYLRVDLSDTGLQKQPAQQQFLAQALTDVVLLKSASHLLQTPAFSVTADLVGRLPRALVQDETGLAIDVARKAYELRLYGDFSDAHWRWSGKPAAQKLRKFQEEAGSVEPLFFTFGYEKDAGSVILVGTRRKHAGVVALGGV